MNRGAEARLARDVQQVREIGVCAIAVAVPVDDEAIDASALGLIDVSLNDALIVGVVGLNRLEQRAAKDVRVPPDLVVGKHGMGERRRLGQ